MGSFKGVLGGSKKKEAGQEQCDGVHGTEQVAVYLRLAKIIGWCSFFRNWVRIGSGVLQTGHLPTMNR